MNRRARSNWDYLKHYTYFVPTVPQMVILFALMLVGALVGNLVNLAFVAILGQDVGMEFGMLLSYPIMFIPPMIYASSHSRRNSLTEKGVLLDSSNFAPKGGWMCALVAALGTIAVSYVADGLSGLLPEMPAWLEETLKSMTSGTLWVDILCVSIFAPIFEEWLCRGMVLRGLLSHKVKPVWSIVISAVFFAVIHLNPWQAIPAFLLGALFGYVYYKTGSLKLTMLMHCVNNTCAVILSRIPALEESDSWKDVFKGSDYWIVMVFCILVVAAAIYFYSRIALKKDDGNCDSVEPLFSQQ